MLSHHPDNVCSTRQWHQVAHYLCICAFIIDNQTQLIRAGLGHCESSSSPGAAAHHHNPIFDHSRHLVAYKGKVLITKANKCHLLWAANHTDHSGLAVGGFDQICETTGNNSLSVKQDLQMLGTNRRLKRLVHYVWIQCEHNLKFLLPTQNIHSSSLHNSKRMKVGRSGS